MYSIFVYVFNLLINIWLTFNLCRPLCDTETMETDCGDVDDDNVDDDGILCDGECVEDDEVYDEESEVDWRYTLVRNMHCYSYVIVQ